MKEFKSIIKTVDSRKYNTWCKYTTRLDTYGCGCQHDCKYCYAKWLLSFRGLWNNPLPRVAYISQIEKKISALPMGSIVKLGGMTDCFQPLERACGVTYDTIKLLNRYGIRYLIVTKSGLVADDKYMEIYDNELAHFQITITNTGDSYAKYENAPSPEDRILAVERLYGAGFDVSVRLSPFIPEHIDIDVINNIKCNKILVEFLKVSPFVMKNFNIDYSDYTLKWGGHHHLELESKIELVSIITGFNELSVGEYVKDHHNYFSRNINHNHDDCCNLRRDHVDRLCQEVLPI